MCFFSSIFGLDTYNPELKQLFLELLRSLILSKLHKLLFFFWNMITYHLSLYAFLHVMQTKNPRFCRRGNCDLRNRVMLSR